MEGVTTAHENHIPAWGAPQTALCDEGGKGGGKGGEGRRREEREEQRGKEMFEDGGKGGKGGAGRYIRRREKKGGYGEGQRKKREGLGTTPSGKTTCLP